MQRARNDSKVESFTKTSAVRTAPKRISIRRTQSLTAAPFHSDDSNSQLFVRCNRKLASIPTSSHKVKPCKQMYKILYNDYQNCT